jgi:hypothetical protein
MNKNKTKILKVLSQNRFNTTYKKKETSSIREKVRQDLIPLENKSHLLVELELAEIFGLNVIKTEKIVSDFKEKKHLTMTSVMQVAEDYFETRREKVREKELVLV